MLPHANGEDGDGGVAQGGCSQGSERNAELQALTSVCSVSLWPGLLQGAFLACVSHAWDQTQAPSWENA